MNRKAEKQKRGHMHGCIEPLCKNRVACTGILSHASRCPPHSDKHTEKILFGTPRHEFL